jgi:hypothetical protein
MVKKNIYKKKKINGIKVKDGHIQMNVYLIKTANENDACDKF